MTGGGPKSACGPRVAPAVKLAPPAPNLPGRTPMSGTSLPKTGLGSLALAVGGTTFYLGAWQIAVAGVALVLAGIAFVRFGWRRGKAVNTP